MLIVGLALVAALLWLLSRSASGSDSGSGEPSTPEGVSGPTRIVQWESTVRSVANEIGFPFDERYALAQIWVESNGDPSAKPPDGGAGEVGLMQVTPPALDDVRAEYPEYDIPQQTSGLEGSPRKQVLVGMLYDRLNYDRAQSKGISNAVDAAIRSYVEGPPPNSSASDNYVNKVYRKYSRLVNSYSPPPM